ncbi:MAG TPA: GWxTD domain-containing protein [Bryobacteraceae bacterium]|jgi:GWxTD domain-containing protein
MKYRTAALAALFVSLATAAQGTWIDLVSPVLTGAEKKHYLALDPEARAKFEEEFWSGKAITGEEYFRRIASVDAMFGSSKPGSGANTAPGRVYLALGPPNKVTRLPSSRIFVPLEIWYYDSVPGVLSTELRLIFYQKNSLGLAKLYSPTADTISALLVPQSSTRGVWGPNDSISESDIRNNLNVPPAEDEVVSAAVNIATGIKYTGNDEILGQISSPEAILRRPPETRVSSRLILARPKMDMLVTPSAFGGSQIDLRLETSAQKEIAVEVLQESISIYKNQLQLKFSKAQEIEYTHRLDLLPGAYQVLIAVDGKSYPYPLVVKEQSMSEIFRTDKGFDISRRHTPFEFAAQQFNWNPNGLYAALALAQAEKVTWMLRRGAEVAWRSFSEGQEFAIIELPSSGLAPGSYQLEAVTAHDSRTLEVIIGKEAREASGSEATPISFNANLAPALRYALIAHQWLLRGNLGEARKNLDASLSKGATAETMVELARVDAMTGRLDEARDRLRRVLAFRPDDFQALSVMAYVETRFQDYPVAAELYRRALAVQDSPALRAALSQLPQQ